MKQEDGALPAFLEAFNSVHGSHYAVTTRPDHANRTTPDVDAWAQSDGLPPLAIEHTSLPSFENAYGSGHVFARHVRPLEAQLSGVYPDMFQVFVPDEALQPGTDWQQMSLAIREWFLAHAGEAHHGLAPFELPGIPGEFA